MTWAVRRGGGLLLACCLVVAGCSGGGGGGGASEASAEGYHQAKFRTADFVDGALPRRLEAARNTAGVHRAVTPLRLLDVIVWMRHRAGHGRRRCAGLPWPTTAD